MNYAFPVTPSKNIWPDMASDKVDLFIMGITPKPFTKVILYLFKNIFAK